MQTLQLLLSGVAQGMIYALVAFGYNITFSTSRTINFSLGNFLMLGGVIAFVLYMTRELPFALALAAVVLVGAVGGAILLKVAVEPSLRQRSAYGWILATLAVSIVLRNAVEVFWSTDDFRFNSPLGDSPLRFFGEKDAEGVVQGGVGVYPQELLVIGVSLAIVAAVELFKRRTMFGRAVLAVSEDKDAASLMGIDQRFVILFSFMLSTAIACVAGVLVAPLTLVSATMGTVLGVKAYAVSIVGGLESGFGVVVGGLLFGLSEALTARYLSTGYKDVPGFVLLILVLLFRPSGLFGRTVVRKV
ncbi:branched-chain amino acid ABC transporter permease [Aggregicoccus sp. 17bor-14]|uniref:branched-chain amino acid ABC transporter permease n=1 Tax=Myxococcaceae TaxID=31 RepID=UPI00129C4C89|nr:MULTISPECIES: branched-chain amino acid ABC transporter permease [Myxococcaceae]MBF5042960.1 branched-chain amino acid ABC transporter permease [Simulacricoccus sp. 17bor-14]MRI88726.1 branched-chain amino acid ABC transporter permease [Aggregicoccus sp. 17bor-14]